MRIHPETVTEVIGEIVEDPYRIVLGPEVDASGDIISMAFREGSEAVWKTTVLGTLPDELANRVDCDRGQPDWVADHLFGFPDLGVLNSVRQYLWLHGKKLLVPVGIFLFYGLLGKKLKFYS